jgi:hypothetical protein
MEELLVCSDVGIEFFNIRIGNSHFKELTNHIFIIGNIRQRQVSAPDLLGVSHFTARYSKDLKLCDRRPEGSL